MGEIRDQVTLTMAIRTFNDVIQVVEDFERPREGDLIHFPLSGGTFVIKYVKPRPVFYQIGALQTWDLVCELFEYSGERFSTGIELVDALQTNYSTDTVADPSLDLDTQPSDFFSDNEIIETESDDTLDFNESNPFGDPD